MEYLSHPNLLLEALAALGRKASGRTWEYTEQRLLLRRAETDEIFKKSFAELRTLTDRLTAATDPDDTADIELFQNIEGFPYNAIGSCSPAFLLYYPMLGEFEGELAPVTDHIAALSQEQVARNILDTLTLTENLPKDTPVSGTLYMSTILALDIPDQSKLTLLNLINEYPKIARRAAAHIAPFLESLKAELPSMIKLTSHFASEMRTIPQEDFFGHLTRLKATDGIRFRIHPFVFGMDTVLAFSAPGSEDTVDIYCGFLREQLLDIVQNQPDLRERTFDCYRILGDRTRFDILCFLKDHSAYGQELASEFELARNTIHHHMSKLVESGLVSATVSGNRVYYALDENAFADFLNGQQRLFLPDGNTPPR
ncbi:MAG: winged helix-turn-helix domain-containing protein [Lachnospiraceae bacterium]|nr:winged helix-turn-helix domain-containing protein [Lachnospiraceae bacterium]